ncbi:MAG: indole-3-glycerol phosphate synthase TrpC [Gemmataceae bacterium]
MADILNRIVETKKQEVGDLLRSRKLSDWESGARGSAPARDFLYQMALPGIRVIAEVKKASPSAGILRAPFIPGEIAKSYADHGAACISVLTDKDYFQGKLADLEEVRAAVPLPVLRKDFLIDPVQVFEARIHGADAILLIAEILSQAQLIEMHQLAESLGMAVLVELHDAASLDKVLAAKPKLVGVNNRDLRTFQVRLEHTLEIAANLPSDTMLVSESGIKTPYDIGYLVRGGVRRFLVGEAFMRSPSPGQRLAELISV